MRIDILTLFPGMFRGPFDESIVRRAIDRRIVQIKIWDIRDFTTDKHRTVDDTPYGGGPGMVMKPEPVFAAVDAVMEDARMEDAGADAEGHEPEPVTSPDCIRILLCPQGRPFNQDMARKLARMRHLVLICGHYEGFDERIRLGLSDLELSAGDYVLTGGELPAMIVVDSVVRLLPGVLSEGSAEDETFAGGLLEYPQYTKPRVFRGMEVPEILLSGHHENIRRWRRKESLKRTWLRRPELLSKAQLSDEDRELLEQIQHELNGEGSD